MTAKHWISTLFLLLISPSLATTLNSTDETSSIAILAKDNGLSRLDLRSSEEENLILAGSIFYATDFYVNRNGFIQLFWSDIKHETIRTAFLVNSTLRNLTLLDLRDVWEIGNVAVDWLAGNLYWIVNSRGRIDVAKTDGSKHCTVVTNIAKPRALALDPHEKLIFWSDWSDASPRIERSTLSGGDRRSIYVVDDVRKYGWINAVALDRAKKLVYWVDAKSHSLHVSNYDGGDRKLIFRDENTLSEPFSLDFSDGELIWSKYSTKAVIKLNLTQVALKPDAIYVESDVFGVKFLSSIQRQPQWEDECVLPSAGRNCSHLCLRQRVGGDRCACPFGMSLKSDQRTCTDQKTVLAFVSQTGKGHKTIFYKDPKDPLRTLSSLILKKESVVQSISYSHSQNLLVWLDQHDANIYYRSAKKTGHFVVPSDTTSVAVAAHSSAEYVYIAVAGEFPSISECSLATSVCVPVVVENVYSPSNLVLVDKNLIWLDFINGKQFIEKYSLRNLNRETVYTGSRICCVASDVTTKHVYWVQKSGLSKLNLQNNVINQLEIDVESNCTLLAVLNGFAYVKNGDSGVRQYDLSRKTDIFVSSAAENVTAIAAIDVSGPDEADDEVVYEDLEAANQVSIDSKLKKFDEKCDCVNGFCFGGKEGLVCVCNDGYSGERCDGSVCDGYCFHGSCDMRSGKAFCTCEGDWFGDRCESTPDSPCAQGLCEDNEQRLRVLNKQFRALFLVAVPVILALALTTCGLLFLWMRTRNLLQAVNNNNHNNPDPNPNKRQNIWRSLIFMPSILKTNEDKKALLDDELNLPNTNV